jgi:ferrous-iron efflux pump FieF
MKLSTDPRNRTASGWRFRPGSPRSRCRHFWSALKLWALAETGRCPIAASLADSALDLMMSLGAAAAIIYAARPADEDHAFGHTSAEDLAALAQSPSSRLLGSSAGPPCRAPPRTEPSRLASEGRG